MKRRNGKIQYETYLYCVEKNKKIFQVWAAVYSWQLEEGLLPTES